MKLSESEEYLLANLNDNFGSSSQILKRTGISKNIIWNWTSGRSSPNLKHLQTIAQNLDIEAYYLIKRNVDLLTGRKEKYSQSPIEVFKINLKLLLTERSLNKSAIVLKHDMDLNSPSYSTIYQYQKGLRILNLKNLDKLALILECNPYQLIEVK